MQEHQMTVRMIERFILHLREEEKSRATIEKYHRDLRVFYAFLPEGKTVEKGVVIRYKEYLTERYAPASVNSMLAAVSSFLVWSGWSECVVKPLKLQQSAFRAAERELSYQEYKRLIAAARSKNNAELCLLMETICATGIRVSELRFITVEAARRGQAEVDCKGKRRVVLLPRKLTVRLLRFARERGVASGHIFRAKKGGPIDRSRVWAMMKALCAEAGVDRRKVFPHNLRHLFARRFYELEKDIVRLADVLGHSNIQTTRIYTMESGETHRRLLERLELVI